MELTRAGADRQVTHSILRGHAMQAWEAIRRGELNPLADLISNDEKLIAYLPARELQQWMNNLSHLGIAPDRAREMASLVRQSLTARNGSVLG